MSAADEIAATRAKLAANRDLYPEPERIGLEALADRNPKLRARVDEVRASLPPEQPMREPEETA